MSARLARCLAAGLLTLAASACTSAEPAGTGTDPAGSAVAGAATGGAGSGGAGSGGNGGQVTPTLQTPTMATSTTPAPLPSTTWSGTTADDGTRRVVIPALQVDAPVFECTAQATGVVIPPDDVHTACWWTGSQPLAARQGTSVVVGHSTRSAANAGALEYLRNLEPGETVTLAGQVWRVVAVLPKVDQHGLPSWVLDKSGPRLLGLITCDTSVHGYNDIVQLQPV